MYELYETILGKFGRNDDGISVILPTSSGESEAGFTSGTGVGASTATNGAGTGAEAEITGDITGSTGTGVDTGDALCTNRIFAASNSIIAIGSNTNISNAVSQTTACRMVSRSSLP